MVDTSILKWDDDDDDEEIDAALIDSKRHVSTYDLERQKMIRQNNEKQRQDWLKEQQQQQQ